MKMMKEEDENETVRTVQAKGLIKDCQYCGNTHQRRKCPAYGKICKKCNRKNHFASVCRSKKVNNVEDERKDEEEVCMVNEDGKDQFFVGSVDKGSSSKEWTSSVEIGAHKVTFTLDTGAQVNILPHGVFKGLKGASLQSSSARLTTYSGERLSVVGKAKLLCKVKDKEQMIEFQIVDTRSKPILGLQGCEMLRLVKRVDLVDKDLLAPFGDVFSAELGCMHHTYKIKIDPKIKPVVHAPRKIPAALRDEVMKELKSMEEAKVIEKVDHPTDWVSSMAVVMKSGGGLRICLDPRDINTAIKREHYKLPTMEEIASRLSGSQAFSVLDAKSAFWQIKLDDSSKDLTTFNTPFGRYSFLRLPFGLNSAAEVFAKLFHQAFEDIPGNETYMDEILVHGRDVHEHDAKLKEVLERARKVGIKLKPSKCSLRVSEVKFVGHTISKDGLKPDNSKVSAIQEMPTPNNRKDLERFLGMINYLGKFLPNLSSEAAPLRELLKQDREWQSLDQHQKAVEDLKRLVTQAPVLTFYDVNKEVTVSVDASQEGLGAVLLQDNKPVAFASRSLTECEKRYAQIEKEMLAVVFGLEHFYYYVYGRLVTVETDHKPLESIIQKPLSAAPPRLQRMLLRAMKYNVNLVYKPGKEMHVSDALSRAPLPTQSPSSDDWEEQVLIINSLLYRKKNWRSSVRQRGRMWPCEC